MLKELILLIEDIVQCNLESSPNEQHFNKFMITTKSYKSKLDYIRIYICDRLWEKVRCRAYFQNRVIGTTGLSKLSAIKCTTRFVVKVTCC